MELSTSKDVAENNTYKELLGFRHNTLKRGMMMRPLENVRVLDLSRFAAGPFCSMMLADMGADVIKIEIPKTGDGLRRWGPPFQEGESVYFLALNRNKKSMTLNLKTERGKEIFQRLIRNADVLLENFRPGTLEQLGFGYEEIKTINPKMIYCRISGYGQTGPYRTRGGYDLLIQGESGLLAVTGEPDRPPGAKVGVAIVDFGTGMYAAYGILLALLVREKTGKGQVVDAALLDAAISWMLQPISGYLATNKHPERLGTAHPVAAPYQVFKTTDSYITIGCAVDTHWRKLCNVLDIAYLANDPRFATNPARVKNREELTTILSNVFASQRGDELLTKMLEVKIPCAPVNTLQRITSDPQVIHRRMVIEMKHPTVGITKFPGIPIKLSETPGKISSPPPLLGQHTDQILRKLGYSDADIKDLREKDVI